ncbi:hypothetical protein Tco_1071569 [Tanacetum coccineum]
MDLELTRKKEKELVEEAMEKERKLDEEKLETFKDEIIKETNDKNIGFNESGEYKETLIGSGVGAGSVQVLQGDEFEVEPLGDHTFEVEPQGNVGQVSGSQKVQTQNFIGYHFARDREQHSTRELFRYREDSIDAAFVVAKVKNIYAHESLTFNYTVACEKISKWKAGLKEEMDARYAHTSILYTDGMVFSYGCKADSEVTKALLDKAKENLLGMEIVRDQSGNTLRVLQSGFYNEKLVHTLLEGHSILSLEGGLSGDCDVEKNGKWSYAYTVGSHEYHWVCTRPDIASANVGMLDGFDSGLQTNVQGFEDLTMPWVDQSQVKEAIWLNGFSIESGAELRSVAGIVTGALRKAVPGSRF